MNRKYDSTQISFIKNDSSGQGMTTFTLDPEIRQIVKILNENGFETNFSCQGGNGRWFEDARIGLFNDLKTDKKLLEKMQELDSFLKQTEFLANYFLSLTYWNSGANKFLILEFDLYLQF